MNATAESNTQYESHYSTLAQVNNRLKELGLRKVLTAESAKTLQQDVSKARFARALFHASTHQQAMDFVKEIVGRLGVDIAPEQHGGQTQPSSNAPETGGNNTPENGSSQNGASSVNPEQGGAPNAPQETGSGNQNSSGDPKKQYKSHHIYGGKAALCLNNDQTRGGINTIRLEAAPAVAERSYNWSEKIAIQITANELPNIIAVLSGMIGSYKADNHGTDQSQGAKGFSIEHQQDKLFVRVYQGGKSACAVPVSPEDTFWALKLVMEQMRLNMPDMSVSDIYALVSRTVAKMKANT